MIFSVLVDSRSRYIGKDRSYSKVLCKPEKNLERSKVSKGKGIEIRNLPNSFHTREPHLVLFIRLFIYRIRLD